MVFSLTQFQRGFPPTRPALTCSNLPGFVQKVAAFFYGHDTGLGHEGDFFKWKRRSKKSFFSETIRDRKTNHETCDSSNSYPIQSMGLVYLPT